MRLAGYDWVPETKLTRSLRETWQRGQTWAESKHLLVTSGARDITFKRRTATPASVTTAFFFLLFFFFVTLTSWDKRRFWGLCSVTAYMRHFPEKLATGVATAIRKRFRRTLRGEVSRVLGI